MSFASIPLTRIKEMATLLDNFGNPNGLVKIRVYSSETMYSFKVTQEKYVELTRGYIAPIREQKQSKDNLSSALDITDNPYLLACFGDQPPYRLYDMVFLIQLMAELRGYQDKHWRYAPAGLFLNWCEEASKFCTLLYQQLGLSPEVFHNRLRSSLVSNRKDKAYLLLKPLDRNIISSEGAIISHTELEAYKKEGLKYYLRKHMAKLK